MLVASHLMCISYMRIRAYSLRPQAAFIKIENGKIISECPAVRVGGGFNSSL